MNEKPTIEYLDIVINNIADISLFSAHRIIQDYINIDLTKEIDKRQPIIDLGRTVQRLGIAYGYFELIGDSPTALRLTEKGRKAKELGGHFKYEKHLKRTPLNTYQKIYLVFFIVFGLLGIYKVFQPTVDIADFQKLKNDFDVLNSRFDSIVKPTSKSTSQKSTDTLQTKNFDVLNTN